MHSSICTSLSATFNYDRPLEQMQMAACFWKQFLANLALYNAWSASGGCPGSTDWLEDEQSQ